ncbi:MAG: aminotransferase class V-fold PLP-dependent enzyme, partial [Firmicutes bacterium]|nr:aminotransferase class V-fold PLP-dependent enzyme [Bacillota bacterium]
MIYVDNAATSYYKPECVKKGIMDYLSHPGNPGRGSHFSSLDASRIVFNTRLLIQEYFDAPSFEKVIFTSGITESLNIVLQGLIHKEDHVITSYLEHNSVLRPLYKSGCELSITDGTAESIEKEIKDNTKAVVINHASNVTGEVQDIRSIGKLCRENHILFIVDSAQSAGVLPISMKEDYIDVLCFTGHKGLLGIQGIGGFCFGDVDIPSFKVGGSGIHSFSKEHPQEYPTRLEAGTLNVPGIVSLQESIAF